ncbi:MAG: DUF3833 domain-containing protein [Limnohabitans sp.]
MVNRRQLLSRSAAGLGAVAAVGLTGCASPSIDDYTQEKPALDLRKYFNGQVDAWGVFTDRNGKVVKRFTVEMTCTWQGEQGVLDEEFVYSDGTRDKRIWRLTHLGDGRYEGSAGDVVGTATGQTRGNTFRWGYTLALPVNGMVLHVSMDDWMYLMNDRVMLNKARMSKWGVHLGDVTLSFTRR